MSSTACTLGGPAVHPAGAALRALLLQMFYSIRSERLLMEQLDYNLLFRGSWDGDRRAGLGPDGVYQEPGTVAEPGRRAQFFAVVEQRAAG